MVVLKKLFRKLLGRQHSNVGSLKADPGFRIVNGAPYKDIVYEINNILNDNEYYIEIGSRTGDSLRRITSSFIAVDPEFKIADSIIPERPGSFVFFQGTSDEFFQSDIANAATGKSKFAFIDGMHLFEFALRDFIGLEKILCNSGVVAVHDVLPSGTAMASRSIERVAEGLAWTGDVWKLCLILRKYRPDLKLELLDAKRTGLLLIHNLDEKSTVLADHYNQILTDFVELDLNREAYELLTQEVIKTSESDIIRTLRSRKKMK